MIREAGIGRPGEGKMHVPVEPFQAGVGGGGTVLLARRQPLDAREVDIPGEIELIPADQRAVGC